MAASTYAHVAELEPHGPDAARRLSELEDELVRVGASSDVKRLRIADDAAKRRDFLLLERFVATGIPLDELSDRQYAKVRQIVGFRNAAALLPLILTWLALSWAAANYYSEVHKDQSLTTQPFLYLWQHHFDHSIIPTFAETALGSFVLLLGVLGLTVWAHRQEGRANTELARINTLADDALNALSLAVETASVRPPDNAQEWAEAAQRVLTETQVLIKQAVEDTTTLATNNKDISETAGKALKEFQTQTEELVKGVAAQVATLLTSLSQQSAQATSRVAAEATAALEKTGQTHQDLIKDGMRPLFDGLEESLAAYRSDQKTYSQSAGTLAVGVKDLSGAATLLSTSVGKYNGIAQSMDERLKLIGTSQTDLAENIAEHSAGIVTASATVQGIAELMTGEMKTDIDALSKNVTAASTSLVAVEQALSETGRTLATTTRAMRETSSELASAASMVAEAARAVEAATSTMTPPPGPPHGGSSGGGSRGGSRSGGAAPGGAPHGGAGLAGPPPGATASSPMSGLPPPRPTPPSGGFLGRLRRLFGES